MEGPNPQFLPNPNPLSPTYPYTLQGDGEYSNQVSPTRGPNLSSVTILPEPRPQVLHPPQCHAGRPYASTNPSPNPNPNPEPNPNPNHNLNPNPHSAIAVISAAFSTWKVVLITLGAVIGVGMLGAGVYVKWG